MKIEMLEASDLTSLQKMIKYEHYLKTGETSGLGRKENIKACGIDKLIVFYQDCLNHNLTKAQKVIEYEFTARNRQDLIPLYNKAVRNAIKADIDAAQASQPSRISLRQYIGDESLRTFIGGSIGLSASDFDDDFVKECKTTYDEMSKEYSNDTLTDMVRKNCNSTNFSKATLQIVLKNLILAIVLHSKPYSDGIFLGLQDIGITADKIKEFINDIRRDTSITNRLEEIVSKLNESLKEDALEKTTPYMLRNDGALLTCGEVHPYIKMQYSQPFEVTLKTLRMNDRFLDWFYENSLNDETKQLTLKVKDELNNNSDTLESDIILLNNLTNQEFCRVRTSNYKYKYGGDNGEIYFRISSEDFNWFDLIWNVVNRFKSQIKFVTIMKDYAATGERFSYVKDGENVFNKMPVDEFLTIGGNPVIEDLNEDIEKHETLNPKLWDENNILKPEVDEKINQIVDEYVTALHDDEIEIKVDDIILIGSNASYNWTKDSDLDIHIIANTKESKYPQEAASKLYSAYRTIFNKNLDIDFYGIPVEIYVEDENSARVSNGVYSVMNQTWIKEPVAEDIPEIDREAFDKEFKIWEDRYKELVSKIDSKLDEGVTE